MAETVVGQIALELNIDPERFKRQLLNLNNTAHKSTSGIKSVFGSVGKVIAGALSVAAITKFTASCLSLGSDLAEVQNVVDVTFGDMTEQANAWAQNAMESFGLSETVAKKYMGTFGAMAKSFGYTTDQALGMSEQLTGLAGDVASFYNLSTDEAYTKLKSVFTGETETLKELGVVMTQSALDAYAMENGWGRTTKAMSEQEKVALRLAFVEDKLSAASGDFARTSGSWANQTRILKLRFDALRASLGRGFIAALTPVLQMINRIMAALQGLADAFANVMERVFGKAIGGSGAIAGDMSGMAASIGDIGDGSFDVADGMGAAADNAERYKKALFSGLDQINKFDSGASSASSGSGSGSGGSGAGGGIFGGDFGFSMFGGDTGRLRSDLEGELAKITTIVSVAELALGAILALTGVNVPLGITLMAIGAAKIATVATLKWTETSDNIKFALSIIGEALSVSFIAIGAVLLFSGANAKLGLGLLAAGAAGMAASVAINWDSINKTVGGKIDLISGIVGGALLSIGAILVFAGAGTTLPLGLGLMAAGAVSLAAAIIPKWDAIPEKTRTAISVISGIVGAGLLALGAILVMTGAGIPLGLGLLAAGGVTLASAIAPNWEGMKSKLKEKWSNFTSVIKGKTVDMKARIATKWSDLKSKWTSLMANFKDKTIKIKASIDAKIANIKGWINSNVIKPINSKIHSVNIGGYHPFSNINIPYLAAGGYVRKNTPQLAVIGDNTREGEIVAPESKIAEAVAVAMAPFMAMLDRVTSSAKPDGNGNIVLTIMLDGNVIFKQIISEAKRERLRTGRNPFELA